jgi:hypothetical protein
MIKVLMKIIRKNVTQGVTANMDLGIKGLGNNYLEI